MSFISKRFLSESELTREEDRVLAVAVVVVLLAHELELVQDVQLLAGGQLFVAHHAREAVEVKHFALGPAHQVAGQDPLSAAVTLGAKSPVRGEERAACCCCSCCCEGFYRCD